MEQQETPIEKISPTRRKRILASAGLLATGGVTGGMLGTTHVAGATTAGRRRPHRHLQRPRRPGGAPPATSQPSA